MSTTKLQDPPIQPPSVGEEERLVHENLLQEWRYMIMNDMRTMKSEITALESGSGGGAFSWSIIRETIEG